MIFLLDSSLTEAYGSLAKETADLILCISKGNHNITCSQDLWEWLKVNVLVNEYLSNWDLQLILKNINLRNVTVEKRKYLSTITVGLKPGMFTPHEAIQLLLQPSLIIVENEENDWAVIRRWIDLLKNDQVFKNINTIVCKRKDVNELQAYNAGSSGHIVNSIKNREKIYGIGTPYKVSILIDSDKTSPTASYSKEKNKIIEAMNSAGIEGHILMKREMENYFTENIYREAGVIDANTVVPSLSEEEWDFIDIENADFTNYKKRQLPFVAQHLDKSSLLRRVNTKKVIYNGECMNEIQMIILKFAKLC